MDSKSQLGFSDISSEESRIYEWGDGRSVKIQSPLRLNVSNSGGHRIVDSEGISHYIPSGWIHIWWMVKEGYPQFVI